MSEAVANECANILGKINVVLKDFNLNEGLSQGFFEYMKPEKALKSYKKSLKKAVEINSDEIAYYIEKRIELLKYIEHWTFDITKLTCCNSHGDYTNNQIIINDNINVIDLTSACRQPVIWELTRFFFHSDISAKDGKLNEHRFFEYLTYYQRSILLNDYDLDNIFKLYFYQILVCDYYSQYFNEENKIKKNDYLNQADFASKVLAANSKLIRSIK